MIPPLTIPIHSSQPDNANPLRPIRNGPLTFGPAVCNGSVSTLPQPYTLSFAYQQSSHAVAAKATGLYSVECRLLDDFQAQSVETDRIAKRPGRSRSRHMCSAVALDDRSTLLIFSGLLCNRGRDDKLPRPGFAYIPMAPTGRLHASMRA